MPRTFGQIPSSFRRPRRGGSVPDRPRVVTGLSSTWSPYDAFRQKRPPSDIELIAANRNATFVCSSYAAEGVASQPLRLYGIMDKRKGHKALRCRSKALSKSQERYFAGDPTISKRLAGVDSVDEVVDHPIIDVLETVNPWFNKTQLIEITQWYLDIIGKYFWYYTRAALGDRPVELWPLPAWMVYVQPDFAGTEVVANYIFTGGGGQAILDKANVLFGRELSLVDPYTSGLGANRANYELGQIYDKNVAYRDSTLSNRGRPDAMLLPVEDDGGTTTGDEAIARIQAEYEQDYSLGRAGKLWVPPGGLKLETLNWSPMDMGELALSKSVLHDIARAYKIPIALVDGESATRASMDASLLAFARFCVKPRCRKLEEHLNSNFITEWDPDGRLFLAFDDPVPADKVAEREENVAYLDKVRTRNEVRASMGEKPVEGGDELYVDSSLTPLSRVHEAVDVRLTPPPVAGPANAQEGGEEIESDDEEFAEGEDIESAGAGKAWEGDNRRPFGGPLTTKDQADRGVDPNFPGDDHDDHEDNTYGLPDGRPIRRTLKKWFKRIAHRVLGTMPTIGAPVTHDWPALADYEDPMASAMTPLLSAYWDESGRVTRSRLGLDPDQWQVVDPNVHRAIETQSHNFCASTLASTTETMQNAYRKLNDELIRGIIEEGEAGPELTKRVQSIFTGLNKSHASMIARTETARAVNTASLMSATTVGSGGEEEVAAERAAMPPASRCRGSRERLGWYSSGTGICDGIER